MKQKARIPLLLDNVLVIFVGIFSAFGLLMIYSTKSVDADGNSYVLTQFISIIIGFILMFFLSRVKASALYNLSKYMLFLAILLAALPLAPFIGSHAGGAQRWINLGIVRFQPGEFVKVFFVIYLAGYYARHENRINEFVTGIFKPLVLVGIISGLFLLQPDFGSSAIVAGSTFAVAIFVGAKLRHIFSIGLVFSALALGVAILEPYRVKRLKSFIDPFSDLSGNGYQLSQSLIAIVGGGFSGVGLGNSVQKLSYLPADHTDFIFSVVAEELGFIGASIVIFLFFIFLIKCLNIADRVSHNTFLYALVVGLTMLIILPAFFNFGVVMGLLPTKGLVLPFIGYGGSNIVASYIAIGLILSTVHSVYKREV